MEDSGAHNRVIYKASDVEYDKVFSQCHSGNSARLRSLQVNMTKKMLFLFFPLISSASVTLVRFHSVCRTQQEYTVIMTSLLTASERRDSQVSTICLIAMATLISHHVGNLDTCQIRIVADDKFYQAIGGGSEKNVSRHNS